MQFEQLTLRVPPREELDNQLVDPRGYVLVNNKYIPLYPRSDYSTGWPILAALGSFWANHFEDRGKLLGLQRANSVEVLQSYITYLEAVAAMSRFDCPIFHRRTWYALILRESTLRTGQASMLKYDGTATYDGTYSYGDSIGNRFQEVPLDTLKNVSLLCNRLIEPSAVWVRGTDFSVDGTTTLTVRTNPFDSGLFPVANILDAEGNIEDREVLLWAFDTREDWEYLYQHYGYAIRHKVNSSASYRDLINGMWNQIVGGPSVEDLEWVLAAVAGIPTVLEARETVETILNYPDKTVVVTDQHGYIYPAGSIARFAAGDAVYARQVLVDTVRVFDLANYSDVVSLLTSPRISDAGDVVTRYGVTPSSSSSGNNPRAYVDHRQPSKIQPGLDSDQVPLLEELPVTRHLLGPGYESALRFRNEVGYFVTDELDSDGVPVGRIETVKGHVDDIAQFWQDAHARGLAEGATWLQLLPVPQPAYVNPAGWVIEHFLRNNTAVVYLRHSKFGDDALGLSALKLLRDTTLPEKLLLYIVDVEQSESSPTISEEADEVTAELASDSPTISSADPIYFTVSLCE